MMNISQQLNSHVPVELKVQVKQQSQQMIEFPILSAKLIDILLVIEILLLNYIENEFVMLFCNLSTSDDHIESEK